MKKTRYVSINHNWFALQTGSTAPQGSYNKTIWDCYNRPSDRKVKIWLDWNEELAASFKDIKTWVHSYNTNFFSIGFYGVYDGVKYAGIIYPTHNDIWEVA